MPYAYPPLVPMNHQKNRFSSVCRGVRGGTPCEPSLGDIARVWSRSAGTIGVETWIGPGPKGVITMGSGTTFAARHFTSAAEAERCLGDSCIPQALVSITLGMPRDRRRACEVGASGPSTPRVIDATRRGGAHPGNGAASARVDQHTPTVRVLICSTASRCDRRAVSERRRSRCPEHHPSSLWGCLPRRSWRCRSGDLRVHSGSA